MIPALIWMLVASVVNPDSPDNNPYSHLQFASFADCNQAATSIKDASGKNTAWRLGYTYNCVPLRVLVPMTPQAPPVVPPSAGNRNAIYDQLKMNNLIQGQ